MFQSLRKKLGCDKGKHKWETGLSYYYDKETQTVRKCYVRDCEICGKFQQKLYNKWEDHE